MTDEFIQSQIDYYRKHLLSGNSADQNLIRGALLYYERLINGRTRYCNATEDSCFNQT